MMKTTLLVLALTGILQFGVAGAEISADNAPGMIFNSGAMIRLKVPAESRVPYEVVNHRDEEVAAGTLDGTGYLTIKSLADGYYRVRFKRGNSSSSGTFAVLSKTAGGSEPSSPYALMTALGDFRLNIESYAGGDWNCGTDFYSALTAIAAPSMVRELFKWRIVERVPNKIDWGRYVRCRENFRNYGIAVCEFFHDTPAWKQQNKELLPGDLRTAYEYGRELARRWRGAACEFWNEPEWRSSASAVWNHAAMAKAFYLGVKSVHPECVVLLSSFCGSFESYASYLLDCGMKGFFDVYNVHKYGAPDTYAGHFARLRNFLARYGLEQCEMWVTENGTSAEGYAMQPVPGMDPKIRTHSYDQELLWAEFIPKAQIVMQSLGVRRTFTFTLASFNEQEGRKHWGLIRYDHTATPGFLAFAVLTRELGRARYEGACELGKNIRAYLFRQPDGTQTLAVWSRSSVDTGQYNRRDMAEYRNAHRLPFTLPASTPVRVVDSLGFPSMRFPEKGELHTEAVRRIQYFHGLNGLKPSVSAPPDSFPAPGFDGDPEIVLRVVDLPFTPDKVKCLIEQPVGFKLQAANFGKSTKRGRIIAPLVEGLPDEFELKSMEIRTFDVRLSERCRAGETLEIGGEFGSKRVSGLKIGIIRCDKLNSENDVPLAFEAKLWRKNSSGQLEVFDDRDENAVCFKARFKPDTDRWCYPELKIPALEKPEEITALAFSIKTERQNPPSNPNYIYFCESNEHETGSSFVAAYSQSDGEWRPVIVPLPVEGGRLRQIRIGMNPKVEEISYSIRDLRLIRIPR